MLVLTRKIDQGIVISGNIVVRVLGVERDRVKLGIQAPIDVVVLRQELLERENGGREPGTAPSTVHTAEDH
jgi:carbon storage regulator